MAKQCVDARFAPAKCHEIVHGAAAAADLENGLAVAAAGFGVEDAGFLEGTPHIRRQYFSPGIAVEAGTVGTVEDV